MVIQRAMRVSDANSSALLEDKGSSEATVTCNKGEDDDEEDEGEDEDEDDEG